MTATERTTEAVTISAGALQEWLTGLERGDVEHIADRIAAMIREKEPVPLEQVRPDLNERERFVLDHIADGYTLAEIQPLMTQPVQKGAFKGQPPGKNAATAATERLRNKLLCHTIPQVIHRAHQLGLLS